MTAAKSWFDVDRNGLAQLIGARGKEFVIFELLSNAWDEASSHVRVDFLPTAVHGVYSLTVTDDNPEGFNDLAHAYTMFASSGKKGNPEQRGRFNLGEKLVLSLCLEASIVTTKGSVIFDDDGRKVGRKKTETGTTFSAMIKMNKGEYNSALAAVHRVIVPNNIQTTLNGEVLPRRQPVHSFETTLATVKADNEGTLRPTRRKSVVRVYDTDGLEGAIYEMGIPVVTTGDRWHYDVSQKVPLNTDRTDVPDAYRRDLRTAVVNEMHLRLTPDDTSTKWVKDALGADDVSGAAVESIMTARFGAKRVIFDSSDPEANKRAVSQGYTVIYAKTLGRDEWANVKRADAAFPAGRVVPTPKPFHPGGRQLQTIPPAKWTKAMRGFHAFTMAAAKEILGCGLTSFVLVDDAEWGFKAAFNKAGNLTVNLSEVGQQVRDAFEVDLTRKTARKRIAPIVELLAHEFAHYVVSDHLSVEYYKELTRLAGEFTGLALAMPELFLSHSEPDTAVVLHDGEDHDQTPLFA